jgi:putative ATP-dependent endonuclease of OLD family
MKLSYFKIEGFRRIRSTEIFFGDASFLIGENNVGKSSILSALEIFHSGDSKLSSHDFFMDDALVDENQEVIFIAEYIGLPVESETWKGFKGRILKRILSDGTIERYILFKKKYDKTGKCIHSLKEYKRTLKPEFSVARTVQDFINAGLELTYLVEVFGSNIENGTNLKTAANSPKLEFIDSIWDIDENSEDWFERPGGIQGNILKRLPRFLLIPAEDRKNDIDGKTGALHKVMDSLFQDVRDSSENFSQAQIFLNNLAQELDPTNEDLEFGKMMVEINSVVGNVFPETGLHVETKLDDADKILKPIFTIEMSSNIRTSPDRQGTGSVRSAAFALLRYREQFIEQKRINEDVNSISRNLIIGFEEPEIYLHPNAANNMRDEIYKLATSSNSQIVCTTHSPYIIDLGRDIDKSIFPKQVLNLLRLEIYGNDSFTSTSNKAFNTTDAYGKLVDDEKNFIKFILRMDDYVSRIFFSKKIIIVEGDTEEIVFRETIKRMEESKRISVQSNYQIIKARGKASIIPIVKYLKILGLNPFVIHDKDQIAGATKFNQPILEVIGDENDRLMLENCMEEVLGYDAPNENKPYEAYKYIQSNWKEEDGWPGVSEKWKTLIETVIFRELFEN